MPKLHIPAIKTKIDTGAKTSALHAWDIRRHIRHGEIYVHFLLHPLQGNSKITRACFAKVTDERTIISSNGQRELRYVIRTTMTLGNLSWEIDISLTNRDNMTFRMLLGRDALKAHTIIDPAKKLYQGKLNRQQAKHLYKQKSLLKYKD